MKIIKQNVEIVDIGADDTIDVYKKIEKAGRTCYKSEHKITPESCVNFIQKIIKLGHESVLEHHNITMKFITDRGVTHELVRHRLASYSQESTRYCNYKDKEIEFILPVEFYDLIFNSEQYDSWLKVLQMSEAHYKNMIAKGATSQLARSVLPNSLKTEIIVTMNIRSWRHFFKLRMSKAAHPQMRDLSIQAYKELMDRVPLFFKDLEILR